MTDLNDDLTPVSIFDDDDDDEVTIPEGQGAEEEAPSKPVYRRPANKASGRRDLDQLNEAVVETAKKVGAYRHGKREDEAAKAQEAPQRAPVKNYPFMVPDYLFEELEEVAYEKRVTIKHLIMSSLKQSGYRVDDIDNPENGQRQRKRK